MEKCGISGRFGQVIHHLVDDSWVVAATPRFASGQSRISFDMPKSLRRV